MGVGGVGEIWVDFEVLGGFWVGVESWAVLGSLGGHGVLRRFWSLSGFGGLVDCIIAAEAGANISRRVILA